MNTSKKTILLLALLPLWCLLYYNLQTAVDWIIFSLLKLDPSAHLTQSLRFFVFEVPKVMLLLTLIIFLMGIVRSFFSAEQTSKLLGGRSTILGNIMAASLGIVTPFCSCSAIPLFLGFVESGVPLGVTFSFLIAAPLINEVAVILLFGMFGWKVALIYVATGLFIAIVAGWIIGRLKLERWVHDWVYKAQMNAAAATEQRLSIANRITYATDAVKEIVGKVWIYIIIGIAVGAAAHGYVPQDFMISLMGKSAWYSVPLSVLIGVPLYSNAAGIVPIVSVLIEKGASLGTALAFMMAVIGLSLPEMIILKKVLKLPLIITFIGIVAGGIIAVGYLFNMLW